MKVFKYHGCGNDFVLFEDYDAKFGPLGSLSPGWVAEMCDRRTGVGADGLIRILGETSTTDFGDADLAMDYYNADGEPAEMCGNGIRCLAVIAHDSGRMPSATARVLTGDGIKQIWVKEGGRVTVDMGPAREVSSCSVSVNGKQIEGTAVSMGNPHFVMFGEFLDTDVNTLGPTIENHSAFPHKTNVEFATIRVDGIALRVWERGVGETLACGTGACAAVVAAESLGSVRSPVTVKLPGGDLFIEVKDSVFMTGPVQKVFVAEMETEPQTKTSNAQQPRPKARI